jgi:hypothetical protein
LPRPQELKSGRSIPRQKLADAIKAVAQHLIEGGVVPEDARIVKVRTLGLGLRVRLPASWAAAAVLRRDVHATTAPAVGA